MLAIDIEANDALPIFALVFTVLSFWWIWLRRGRLTVAAPRYQAMAGGSTLRVRFPFAFVNGGARAIVVEDLRLVVDGQVLDWISTRKTIKPIPDDVLDFAKPFIVEGRAVALVVAEFGTKSEMWSPASSAVLEVVLERIVRNKWKRVGQFTWWTPPAERMGNYIASRNRPEPYSV